MGEVVSLGPKLFQIPRQPFEQYLGRQAAFLFI